MLWVFLIVTLLFLIINSASLTLLGLIEQWRERCDDFLERKTGEHEFNLLARQFQKIARERHISAAEIEQTLEKHRVRMTKEFGWRWRYRSET